MTQPVVVTGANGYLGGRLVGALAGYDVRPLVRKGVRWLPPGQLEVDLLDDAADLAAAMDGADAVVHLAGHNEVVAADDPDRAIAETVVMTRRVTEAAGRAGVRRLIYVSTVHVYGARITDGARLDEAVVPEPRSAYAIARLASEHVVAGAASAGVEPIVLRLTNAVGAPADPSVDRWTLVASDLSRQAARTGTMTLRSTGQQWRDFVSLADVARVLAGCVIPDRPEPGTYNLASGRATTIRGLAELVADRFEARTSRRPTLQAPPPDGPDPEPYTVVPDRLTDAGWRLDTPLADAVDELVEFCLDADGGSPEDGS